VLCLFKSEFKNKLCNARDYNNELYLFWKEYHILQCLILREYTNIVIPYGNMILICLVLREYNNIVISLGNTVLLCLVLREYNMKLCLVLREYNNILFLYK